MTFQISAPDESYFAVRKSQPGAQTRPAAMVAPLGALAIAKSVKLGVTFHSSSGAVCADDGRAKPLKNASERMARTKWARQLFIKHTSDVNQAYFRFRNREFELA